jgi:transcriptional regulatory protein RtcR
MIKFWTFTLPPLRRRLEDMLKLVDFFIDEWSQENNNINVTFENDAAEAWLEFSTTGDSLWAGNLRELNHSIKKMCYYARSGDDIITLSIVHKEIEELQHSWKIQTGALAGAAVGRLSASKRSVPQGKETVIPQNLLPYLHKADKLALEEIIKLCGRGGSLQDAGRMLYSVASDTKEKNYSDLARKFLDHCAAKLPDSRFILERGKGLVLRVTN